MWTSPVNKTSDARTTGRVHCTGVRCSLGHVMNLSAGGARIVGVKARRLDPGDSFQLTIHTDFGEATVTATVARKTKKGFFQAELGVAFSEVDDHARNILSQVGYACAQEAHQLFHSMRRAS
jgi:hypothetical protein